MHDQIALLDRFADNIGQPHRTVVRGQSLGAAVSTLLAERYPRRFDGVLATCGAYGRLAAFNATLDVDFAVQTLLAPGEDIDLVRAGDPAGSRDALLAAVDRVRSTPQGQASTGRTSSAAAWSPSPTSSGRPAAIHCGT
jgi:pimeloyl-ACP methyl ester carboxylesterase